MPVCSPVITEIGKKTYHINEYGLASIYLIVGQERALLIDTGAGMCDLTALVRRITFLPFEVALTHYHVGHSGGMGQFGRVYVHPADAKNALEVTPADRRAFALRPRETDDRDVFGFDPEHPRSFAGVPELCELYDHQSFDLGGRTVLVLHTPGHTSGSCSFLDLSARLVITGDACEYRQIVTECAVSTQMRGLFNLHRCRGAFDRIYGGHINYKTVDRTRSAKPVVLQQNIAACRCVLEDNAAKAANRPRYTGATETIRVGSVWMTYDTAKIWEPEENHAPLVTGA